MILYRIDAVILLMYACHHRTQVALKWYIIYRVMLALGEGFVTVLVTGQQLEIVTRGVCCGPCMGCILPLSEAPAMRYT
jgi:hypothetical protein